MNILIVSAFNVRSYSRGIMLDQLAGVLEDKSPDDNIFYVDCNNTFNTCYFNFTGDPGVCFACKANAKNSLGLVPGDYTHLDFGDLINTADQLKAKQFFLGNDFVDFDTRYENLELGEALLSVYISNTRNRDLTLANDSLYIKKAKFNTIALYLGVKRFLTENSIDKVISFNGRQDYKRAVLRASEATGVDCYNYEQTRPGGYLEFFLNNLPHNIEAKTEWIEKAWVGGDATEAERLKIGSSFFYAKRDGQSVVDRAYNKNQIKGLIPIDLDNSKKTLVLFNSSDDEFAAVGKEYANPFFIDQYDGIKHVVELVGKFGFGYNLVIRVHPNLKGITEDYATGILSFHQSYPNIFVIKPESDADSYALLDIADKVIVFGSSIGIEANFWKKPVILLAKSFYYLLDVAYIPNNKEEVKNLLFGELPPKSSLGAFKYGYYALKGGVKSKFYNQEEPYAVPLFKGKKMNDHSIKTRIQSKILSFMYKKLKIKF